MDLEAIASFFTSKTGVFAAIVAIISATAGVLGIIRPWLKQRREAGDKVPKLVMSPPKVTEPPPWSEAGEVEFQMMNSGGGKAIMTELRIEVLECRKSEKLKMVEPAAPVPQFTFKVKLRPDVKLYDVRRKKFGAQPGPQSYEPGEVESYLVELTSDEPQWYKFQLCADWYDVTKADKPETITSPPLTIDFAPEPGDLVG